MSGTWRPTPPCAHCTRTYGVCLICQALSRRKASVRWLAFQARAPHTMATRLEAVRRALDARLGLNPGQEATDGR